VCSIKHREKRLLYGWKVICSVIPGFRVDLLALAKQRKVQKAACQQVSNISKHYTLFSNFTNTIDFEGSYCSWSDDTASLKVLIPEYLLLNVKDVLTPPMLSKEKVKNDRGPWKTGKCRIMWLDIDNTSYDCICGHTGML
jgi:hypothetical protein